MVKDSKVKKGYCYYGGKKLTSEMLTEKVQEVFRKGGVEGDIIMSSGTQAALPHHHGSGPVKAGVPIIMDIYPRHSKNRYFCDMTRTVCKGKPTFAKFEEYYKLVYAAQQAGYAKVKSGATGKQVDAAVRKVFIDAGVDKYFIHSTGHGLGIDIHESPGISPRGTMKLKAGMVITNEPGLYIPGKGGIRIEDSLVVTKSGYRILAKMPKKFIV